MMKIGFGFFIHHNFQIFNNNFSPIVLQLQQEIGGFGRELSEDEYDALNDETFNHAVKDDWEGKCVFVCVRVQI
jgi:hypothetical protein